MSQYTGGKWGASKTFGTAGGVVTWSMVDSGFVSPFPNFFTGNTVDPSTVFKFDY